MIFSFPDIDYAKVMRIEEKEVSVEGMLNVSDIIDNPMDADYFPEYDQWGVYLDYILETRYDIPCSVVNHCYQVYDLDYLKRELRKKAGEDADAFFITLCDGNVTVVFVKNDCYIRKEK